MTYGEVIKRCDELVPNSLSAEYKMQLLFEFECDIMLKVMLLSQTEVDEVPEPNADTELTVRRPHSKIYRLWLCSVLHKSNGDYDDAANITADFDTALREFVQWYGRTVAPGRMQAVFKGYYLSAYAIAVKYGFTGTEEQWLASLVGPKGDAFTYEDFTEEQLAALKGDTGADGYTPVRGVDYWTDADKSKIAETAAENVVNDYAIRETIYIGLNGYCYSADGIAYSILNLNIHNEDDLKKYNFVLLWDKDDEYCCATHLNAFYSLTGEVYLSTLVYDSPRYELIWGTNYGIDDAIDFVTTEIVGDYLKDYYGVLSVDKTALLGDIGDQTMKEYTDKQIGDIETALDNIIALQEAYTGGESA